MSKTEDFLTPDEEQEIIEAIQTAEQNTSGEIRIHIERGSSIDAYGRAKKVFRLLKMDNTKLHNGVLIYVDVEHKTFAICGDKGIHEAVSQNFWDSTKDVIQAHFKKKNFKQGLIDGILKAGEQLQKHFPWEKGDANELSDEISKS